MNEQQVDQPEYTMDVLRNPILRTAILRILEEMLDNPDSANAEGDIIYSTTRFMDRIETLIESLMAAPESMQLSGSEAVFGFAAWLTTADRFENAETNPGYGPTQDTAYWCELVGEFNKVNKLAEPREEWSTLLTHPTSKAA